MCTVVHIDNPGKGVSSEDWVSFTDFSEVARGPPFLADSLQRVSSNPSLLGLIQEWASFCPLFLSFLLLPPLRSCPSSIDF